MVSASPGKLRGVRSQLALRTVLDNLGVGVFLDGFSLGRYPGSHVPRRWATCASSVERVWEPPGRGLQLAGAEPSAVMSPYRCT